MMCVSGRSFKVGNVDDKEALDSITKQTYCTFAATDSVGAHCCLDGNISSTYSKSTNRSLGLEHLSMKMEPSNKKMSGC